MNQPITRNGSGYFDETAFLAIRNTMKGKSGMRNGEIWEIKTNSGMYRHVIVLADHDRFSEILVLESESSSGSIEVRCKGIMYSNPKMISYAYGNNFISFVRTLSDNEYKTIMDAVAEGLGIATVEKEVRVEVPVEVIKEVGTPANIEEMARLRAEAEIYKGMYESLLQQMIGKGGSNG